MSRKGTNMLIQKQNIDGGKAFDWGRTSEDYAKFRDIYPPVFYENIVKRGLCIKGQKVLDLGTGTGVLPRNMYAYGASWCGTDISPEQIAQAKRMAEEAGMEIDFRAASAEETDFPDASFDVITACQCFWYFDHKKVVPELARMLKPGGTLLMVTKRREWYRNKFVAIFGGVKIHEIDGYYVFEAQRRSARYANAKPRPQP